MTLRPRRSHAVAGCGRADNSEKQKSAATSPVVDVFRSLL